MKIFLGIITNLWILPTWAAGLILISNDGPQSVFCGEPVQLRLLAHNTGDADSQSDVVARIFQASSTTLVQFSQTPWKKLRLLPGQTVLDSAQLNFPIVRAPTRFVVQWAETSGPVIGVSDVMVYPTNLLAGLKNVAANEPLGVFDPLNHVKPLLRSAKREFVDLGESTVDDFEGKLAIIGPFESKSQMPSELADQVQSLAAKGVAAVWIQPPEPDGAQLRPSFYTIIKKQVATVIVQPHLLAQLGASPVSQCNLIYFCKLALAPHDFSLPGTKQNE